MIPDLFKKKRYITVKTSHLNPKAEPIADEDATEKPIIPDGMWMKCESCGKTLYAKDVEDNLMVCNNCSHHFRLKAYERIKLIVDEEAFVETDKGMTSVNPLDYPGYTRKIKDLQDKCGISEAVVTGIGKIGGYAAAIAVMDSRFMMASMGSVVGEKITRTIETAIKERIPLIIFTASGGARMQEGMYSLMQMAKISGALARLNKEGLLYITVLTDPTTGGVTASFAMLGDIIISEPGALVGFAGRRVIESTIKEKLPDSFQKAEFLLEHGFADSIVERKDLKNVLVKLLKLHKEA